MTGKVILKIERSQKSCLYENLGTVDNDDGETFKVWRSGICIGMTSDDGFHVSVNSEPLLAALHDKISKLRASLNVPEKKS